MAQDKDPKKVDRMQYVHSAIGIAICVIFWILAEVNPTALSPVTPIGLRCLGAFLAMVYLWSTVGTLWPSVFGLMMIGMSGVGEGATAVAQLNNVWLNAIGNNTVVLVLFGFVLFGAVDHYGTTSYIAKFLLTRKFYAGKPIMFLAVYYFTCYFISAFVGVIVALIMLWPIALKIAEVLDITREDKMWKWFFVGMFLVMTLGQPFIPFKGAPLIPVSAFATMTANLGTPMEIPYAQYMVVNFVMTFFVMGLYLGFIKVRRIDVSKLAGAKPAIVEQHMPLPAMNFQQRVYLYMIFVYVLLIVVPGFLPPNPFSTLIASLGAMGVTIFFVVVLSVWRYNGAPMLEFGKVAVKNINWGIFFMIMSAVYAAGTLSNAKTGVSPWLVQVLNPLLGGQPEMVFVALMFTTALVITNFANNAAMATVLMPVVINFSNQIGINPIPVATGVILMVFVAMLTPAASPHAGMMWGRRDIYDPKDIISVGLPMCIVTLVSYIFIGYPLIKLLIGA